MINHECRSAHELQWIHQFLSSWISPRLRSLFTVSFGTSSSATHGFMKSFDAPKTSLWRGYSCSSPRCEWAFRSFWFFSFLKKISRDGFPSQSGPVSSCFYRLSCSFKLAFGWSVCQYFRAGFWLDDCFFKVKALGLDWKDCSCFICHHQF